MREGLGPGGPRGRWASGQVGRGLGLAAAGTGVL